MNFTELVGPIENSTPAHLQTAILWGPESLLMDSVEFFLKSRVDWDVVKILSECGVDCLIERVESLRPAVVILCQERDANDFALLTQLAQTQICLKVILVSMESNLIQIYSKRNLIMRDVSDLLSVVGHEYFSNSEAKEEV